MKKNRNPNHKFYQGRGGQNIIEYLLLTVAVILVLLLFLGPQGFFRGAFERTLDISFNQINSIAQNIDFGNGAIP